MRACLLLIAAVSTLQAAVVRGTVTEHVSGYALAGAVVTLQPAGSATTAPVSLRTNTAGNFEFHGVAPGIYIVHAARKGFMTLEYGQRQWNSAGLPVVVTENNSPFLPMQLHRPGAITGVVRDGNDVGLAGNEVAAYRNTQPPELVTHAKTDDRGVYRLAGLDPGLYLIRTTGALDRELSYVPTFGKQTIPAEGAQLIQVYLDEDSKGADIYPIQGKLFTLSGFVAPAFDDYTFTVTLASDTGRRVVNSSAFVFGGLPPGAYELYAEAHQEPPGTRFWGGYTQLTIHGDMNRLPLPMQEVRETSFIIQPKQNRASSVSILERRKDLAGVGPVQVVTLNDGAAPIPPGRWEMMAAPPAGQYVSQFSNTGRDAARPDGWNEETIRNFNSIRIAISGGAPVIHGVVKVANEPAGGAPVFLEAWDPENRKRLADLRSTRTDAMGRYTFDNLAPGVYRLVSTFEYLTPDSAAMDLALPRTVKPDAHTDTQIDLDLYGLR